MTGRTRQGGTRGGPDADRAREKGRAAAEQESDGVEEALALVSRPRTNGPGTERDPGRAAGRDPGREQDQDRDRRSGGAAATASPASTASTAPSGRPRPAGWAEARELAARTGRATPPRTLRVPWEQALGRVLGAPLIALCDLPSFDTSAMDGWAVAGPGPWAVHGGDAVLAGRAEPPALEDGTAVRIATGARIPPEATAVIRSEHAHTDAGQRLLHAERAVTQGQEIRPRGQECRSGDRLLPAGSVVTPAVLGLASAAGYDELEIAHRPRVEVLILGDELLTGGLPHDGLIRDALGPMVGPWLSALGAEVIATRRLGDDARALQRAITGSAADLLLTTGGTASGPVDHVRPVLLKAGAELLVDSVAVRPGHPMLLAALPPRSVPARRRRSARDTPCDEGRDDTPAGRRYLVGLPGNPLAAVSGLLTLAEPLLRGLSGLPDPLPYRVPVRGSLAGHPHDTLLKPFAHGDEQLLPLRYSGPAMLRGIAAADGLAVVPPGGARPGDRLEVLDLPWMSGVPAGAAPGRFT
ncbi:molybdopterin molybdotransferase MoeA [Streptomyces sp. NPDC001985]|uniref:molybdopterin molybdotransferase MoeA n=1 Tax=Streptomyces sp. NPDC001985 TaxID=3154406 RepID=UPI00331A5C3F